MTGNHIEPMRARQVGDRPKGRGQRATATRRNRRPRLYVRKSFNEVRTTQRRCELFVWEGEKGGLQGVSSSSPRLGN
jgi:hypothetical protein